MMFSALALVLAVAQPPVAVATEAQRLSALFTVSDEASLKRNPLNALARGDDRYADQFGDYLSDRYVSAEKAAAQADLAELQAIHRSALSSDDRIAYDVFRWQRELDLRGYLPDIVAATIVRPIEHLKGLHVLMSEFSAGDSIAPFRTRADYQNNLKRLAGFITYLDGATIRMREGMSTGVVQPRIVMEKVVQQLDDLVALGIKGSPYYRPVTKFPASVAAADRARLKLEYADFIGGRLLPAHQRLRDFIKMEYLPRARSQPGLSSMPGGEVLYRYLIANYTTTEMSPAEIHRIGLAEGARIEAEMETVKTRVGFKGTLKEFAAQMRSDPRFHPKSAKEIRDRYLSIEAKVKTRLPSLFSMLPRATLEIRAFPELRAKTAPNASYSQGTPDGSRPGVFYFNASDLSSRVTFDAESLFLHEGIPGHHTQNNLAQENEKLPSFLRFDGNAAFGEGWALYAESLGSELGLYTDPYQLYGRLTNEMFRSTRLVVDTGIHALGWSRERALSYMLDHTAYSEAMLAAEVDRYIAYPAQALAYKTGELTIRRLRTKAERAMAARFDVREFHRQVLETGRLPMPVLEAKIDRWIAGHERD